MKCPHCGYEDGIAVDREEGEFYAISNDIIMTSEDKRDMYLYGCPKCKKLFMD